MQEYHWLPWEIDRIPQRTLLELTAMHRLEAERSKREASKAKARSGKKR